MFLIRPKPYQNESILSYLVRASHVNGLKDPLQILKAIGFPIANNRMPYDKILFGEYAKNALCEAFNLSETEFSNLFFYQSDGLTQIDQFSLPSTIIRANHPRFCPYCLQEMGYIDNSILYLPKTYCSKHQTALIDTLDGKRLKWSTPFLFQHLLELKPSDESNSIPSTSVIVFNECIDELMSNENPMLMPVQIGSLNLDETSKLIDFSIRYRHRANSDKPLNIANYTNDQLVIVFEDANSFICNWPQSFDELLRYYERNPMSHGRGKHGVRYCFRDLYDELYAKQNEHSVAYALLRERFEHYLSTQFSESPFLNSISRISVNLKEQSLLVNRKQAAKILNCHVGKVDIYVREGLLQPETSDDNFFNRKVVELLALRIKNCLTLNQVASALDISVHNAKKLLINQIIKPLLVPTNDNRDWLVEKKEMLRFFSVLKRNALSIAPDNTTVTTFKRLTFQGIDFIALIRQLLNHEIDYVRHLEEGKSKKRGLNQFQICTSISNEKNDRELITPHTAAKLISVNINAVYFWLNHGFINSIRQKEPHVTRPIIMIDINEVRSFTSKYLLSKDKDKKQQYELVSGPKSDGGIVNLYIKN